MDRRPDNPHAPSQEHSAPWVCVSHAPRGRLWSSTAGHSIATAPPRFWIPQGCLLLPNRGIVMATVIGDDFGSAGVQDGEGVSEDDLEVDKLAIIFHEIEHPPVHSHFFNKKRKEKEN